MINVRRKCRWVLKLSFNRYHLTQDVIYPKRCRCIQDYQGAFKVQVHKDMERLQGNHSPHCHLCYLYLFEAWLNKSNELEIRHPSEEEISLYLKYLREKGMASSTMWTMYSMLNSVTKSKYNFALKQYSRVTSLLKSFDTDIKKKAKTFSKEEFDNFVGSTAFSSPYWLVRKV